MPEYRHDPLSDHWVIIAPGPWARSFWKILDLPEVIHLGREGGRIPAQVKMWTYWCLQEGTLGVDPGLQKTNDGRMPPVIHFDCDLTIYSHNQLYGRWLIRSAGEIACQLALGMIEHRGGLLHGHGTHLPA